MSKAHCLRCLLLIVALDLVTVSARSSNRNDDPSMTFRAETNPMDATNSTQVSFRQMWWCGGTKLRRSLEAGTQILKESKRTSVHKGTTTAVAGSSPNAATKVHGKSSFRKDKRQKQHGNHRTMPQICSRNRSVSLWQPQRRLWTRLANAEATTRTAYSMAVLATLAYGEFHKQSPLLLTVFQFSLLQPNRRGRRIKLYLCRIGSWFTLVRDWIRELLPLNLAWHDLRLPRVDTTTEKSHGTPTAASYQDDPSKRHTDDRESYTLQYWLYNWFEPTGVAGLRYHDTDLLVSTSRKNKVLVLAFAGTQSAADHITNVQTFEPAAHSGFFHGGGNVSVEGSIHRGFLNAYARVERGSVLRLCRNCSSLEELEPIYSLHRRYGRCTRDNKKQPGNRRPPDSGTDSQTGSTAGDASATVNFTDHSGRAQTSNGLEFEGSKVTSKKSGGCRTRDEKLTTILRELVTKSLRDGYTVHVSGHSQGGSLATLLALDIVINFPDVPISSFHLWTYGAPQVADDLFLQSAIATAPRLLQFLQEHGKRRFHRFVTLSDDCRVDFVSTVTERALPAHKRNLRGKAARALGGVRGSVVHFAKPHYLLTPHQFMTNNEMDVNGTAPNKTTTTSTLAAHSTINYLLGISRESRDHPLSTDLPSHLKAWFGEVHAP